MVDWLSNKPQQLIALRAAADGRETLGGSDKAMDQERSDSSPMCDHCGERIPQFPHLSAQDEGRVRALIRANTPLAAARELMAFVGCDERQARLWVEHRGQPLPVTPGPPCRSCGQPLATSLARQCLHCGMDWHDEAGPRTLGPPNQPRSRRRFAPQPIDQGR